MAKLSQHGQKSNAAKSASSNASSVNGVTKVKRTRKTVPRDSPPQRSSIYRGVTRLNVTFILFKCILVSSSCSKWQRTNIYLSGIFRYSHLAYHYSGAYDDEEAAAHAYDLAALKYWGQETILNFPLYTYEKEWKGMEGQSREEYIGSLRRKSSGFSRGVSKFRGVARHHHNGRWEARIGRVFGNKYLYLGTYATQEEAAVAYDMAAIEYRGLNAVTNFDLSRYIKWLRPDSNNTSQPNPSAETTLTPNPSRDLGLNFFHQEHQHLQQQQSPSSTADVTLTQSRPTTATSALGLLLQSSKFKEMMEMTSAAECPSTPPARCSFPEDIQTYFESQDFGSNYGEGEDVIFGELNSFMQPLLHSDFNA
ncbi:hypothetical protein RJ640_017704 [Escallonia rubra]|uniref:AP2/ERF domain-containing protein n=1 Tax=Escallonia rubra TaxID=112253 RepID=A0AA88RIV9_9ASTE|nr:hypothetical protein RJ640_017704 [Escallonia rubra]